MSVDTVRTITVADAIHMEGLTVGFEVMPPRKGDEHGQFASIVGRLATDGDAPFISVTYGAGGNAPQHTEQLVTRHAGRLGIPVMPHLICAGHRTDELKELVDRYAEAGVSSVLALRGDPPKSGDADFAFDHAIDLATWIKDRYPQMAVGVAAHPDTHPDSPDSETDIGYLVDKLRVADFAITQMLPDTIAANTYLAMMERLYDNNVTAPILPGLVLPKSPQAFMRLVGLNRQKLHPDTISTMNEIGGYSDKELQLHVLTRFAIDNALSVMGAICEQLPDTQGAQIFTTNQVDPAIALRQKLLGL